MTSRRIALVAWHVFKESVRDRVLYGIAGFAVRRPRQRRHGPPQCSTW